MLRIIKLLEEADTELDVEVEERRLCRALHEDNFHQLLQQRRIIVKVIHELMLDFVEVFFGDLIQENTKLSDLRGELVMRLLLSTE